MSETEVINMLFHKDIISQGYSTFTKEFRVIVALPVPLGLVVVHVIRSELFREVLKAAIIVIIRKTL